MSSLTLVSHHLCPYVQRAAIALSEKGVVFERVTIDLAAKPDWFKAISPLGKVPLLRVARPGRGEAVLFESAVICEYIEETQPGPALHPSDPIERAEHRGWIEFGSSILADIYAIETTPDAALFETRRQALAQKFARIEDVLGTGPLLRGQPLQPRRCGFRPGVPLLRRVRHHCRSRHPDGQAEGRRVAAHAGGPPVGPLRRRGRLRPAPAALPRRAGFASARMMQIRSKWCLDTVRV